MADTNVVASVVPANDTAAPLTKLLPVSVREKEPVAKLEGLTPVSTGTGFSSVTLLEEVALEAAALAAVTVTIFGFGTVAGA